MQSIRKTVIDKFQQYLVQDYVAYCVEHGLEENAKCFLTFLMDRDFIPTSQINRYAVSCEYRELSLKDKKKTKKIKAIANFFNLSERHVWSLIKYDMEKNSQ